MSKVVIGMANENLESDLRSLLDELSGFTVEAVATTPHGWPSTSHASSRTSCSCTTPWDPNRRSP